MRTRERSRAEAETTEVAGVTRKASKAVQRSLGGLFLLERRILEQKRSRSQRLLRHKGKWVNGEEGKGENRYFLSICSIAPSDQVYD